MAAPWHTRPARARAALLLVAWLGAPAAHADEAIDPLTAKPVGLYQDAAQAVFRVAYPGMANGRYDDPNCLELAAANATPAQLTALAGALRVDEAFDFAHQATRELPAHASAQDDAQGPSLQYAVTNLGAYITQLRVATLSGQSLAQVADAALGARASSLSARYRRGCRAGPQGQGALGPP